MGRWDKIITSGSDAHLNTVTSSKGIVTTFTSSFAHITDLSSSNKLIVGGNLFFDDPSGQSVHAGASEGSARVLVMDVPTGRIKVTSSYGGGGSSGGSSIFIETGSSFNTTNNIGITGSLDIEGSLGISGLTITDLGAVSSTGSFIFGSGSEPIDPSTINHQMTGSLSITGSGITLVNGVFTGDGSGLTGITAESTSETVTVTELDPDNPFEQAGTFLIPIVGGAGSQTLRIDGNVQSNPGLRWSTSGNGQLTVGDGAGTINGVVSNCSNIRVQSDFTGFDTGDEYSIPLIFNDPTVNSIANTFVGLKTGTDNNIIYNPVTDTITVTNFNGTSSLSSNSEKIYISTKNEGGIEVADLNEGDGVDFIIPFTLQQNISNIFPAENAPKFQNLAANESLKFNPSTGLLTATKFSGDGSTLSNVEANKIDINEPDSDIHRLTMVIGGDNVNNNFNQLFADNILTWDNTNSRLGIGTNSPTQPLHVNGNTIIKDGILNIETVGINDFGLQLSTTSTSGYTSFVTQTNAGLEISNTSGADRDIIIGNNSTGNGNKKDSLTIKSNGNILTPHLEGSVGSFFMLYDNSTGEISYQASTRKVKKNIKPAKKSLYNDILKLTPSTFNRKNPKSPNLELGLIAEEAAEVNPLFAFYGKNFKYNRTGSVITESGSKATQDDSIVPVNVNWNAIVTALVGKIQSLEQRISELEK